MRLFKRSAQTLNYTVRVTAQLKFQQLAFCQTELITVGYIQTRQKTVESVSVYTVFGAFGVTYVAFRLADCLPDLCIRRYTDSRP